MAKVQNDTMDKLVALCKGRGFVFPGSEIYGGLANSWDYGPLGVEFKNNVKRAWWKKFVQESKYNVGLDCAILMNRQVWVASGHVGSFNDPLMDCKACKARFRADKLIEDWAKANGRGDRGGRLDERASSKASSRRSSIPCPTCGKHDFTGIRKFNLMFKTHQGVTEDASNEIYLRPETAQGIFVNFPNVAAHDPPQAAVRRLPGRQELPQRDHPGQLHLPHPRVRADGAGVLLQAGHGSGVVQLLAHLLPRLAARAWASRTRTCACATTSRRSWRFYSKATTDFEYLFPFGWGELWGVADRTDYDLNAASDDLRQEHGIPRPDARTRSIIPYVIEPSLGADRAALAFLCDAYEEQAAGGRRHPRRAASSIRRSRRTSAAVLPLQKNKLRRARPARSMTMLSQALHGRLRRDRLHRQALSPPGRDRHAAVHHRRFRHRWTTGVVTVRDRDTMEQDHVHVDELVAYIQKKIEY